jgi:ribosome-binding protein aMBF1 (putative translation factor)
MKQARRCSKQRRKHTSLIMMQVVEGYDSIVREVRGKLVHGDLMGPASPFTPDV